MEFLSKKDLILDSLQQLLQERDIDNISVNDIAENIRYALDGEFSAGDLVQMIGKDLGGTWKVFGDDSGIGGAVDRKNQRLFQIHAYPSRKARGSPWLAIKCISIYAQGRATFSSFRIRRHSSRSARTTWISSLDSWPWLVGSPLQ